MNRMAMFDTIQSEWENGASIRARPKRFYCRKDAALTVFPVMNQPICLHPIIKKLPSELIEFILIQSSYYYLYNIALIETELVNKAAFYIANAHLSVLFNNRMRHDALTIIIDEAYHAYVAMDFINQIETELKIAPLKLPITSNVTVAIDKSKNQLPTFLHKTFEVIAVCLSEHTLTLEIAGISRAEDTCQFFKDIMMDHLIDEGRHVKYFKQILQYLWAELDNEMKDLLSIGIGDFLEYYTDDSEKKSFERDVLNEVGLSEKEIETIMNDTYFDTGRTSNSIIENYIKVLKNTNVLNYEPLFKYLVAKGFINITQETTL